MNEPFIIEEETNARRESGFNLTGWETVIFELEDEPRYDGGFGSDS